MSSSSSNSGLRGKRGRLLLRASTLLNDASTEDQKIAIQKFMKMHGIVHVKGDEVLEGVSGSKTFNRQDLERLLASARQKKDYDLLMVYDSSRLTRGGAGHGFSIRKAFAKAGVLVLSVVDPVPDGDFKDVMQSLIDTQNNLFSKKLSGLISRGVMSSILRGDIPTHGGVPIGVDRVYYRADDTPFLRVRHVGHNFREQINEESGKLIARYGRGESVYRKQKSEKVRLAMGDRQVVDAIREIFELRYKYGWGYAQLALRLTQLGIKPRNGGWWQPQSVHQMVSNPIYLGWSYFLQSRSGLFTQMSPDGPITRTDINQDKLEEEKRLTVPHLPRRVDEMIRIEHPALQHFILDPFIREKAEAAITKKFDEFHLPKRPMRMGAANRYPYSRYILRHLMWEKTYKRHLVGRVTSGPKAVRYYHLSNNTSFSEKGSVGRRTIPAEPLEQAVLNVLRSVFSTSKAVEKLVNEYVARVLSEKSEDFDRDSLEKELAALKSRQRLIYTTASLEETQDLQDVLANIRVRQDEIRRQLSLKPLRTVVENPRAISEEVYAALVRIENKMDDKCFERLRLLLATIIRNFVIDLGTREAEFEVWLPEEFLLGGELSEVMCATSTNVHSSARRAHNSRGIKIGVFKLIPPPDAVEMWPKGGTYKWVEAKLRSKKNAA